MSITWRSMWNGTRQLPPSPVPIVAVRWLMRTTRRFMSEVAGVRRYHRDPARATAAARGGVLWVAVRKGWSCNPDRVANFIAIVSAQGRES